MGPSGSSFLGRGTRGVGHLNGKRRERSVSKFLLQPKGLTSPPGYCGYLQHLDLSRKRGTPFKVCRISPFLALNAHSAPGSRLVFQRFSLGTHRFSSRRTEETVAGDRSRPRRGCEDACNPLIFRKTLKGGSLPVVCSLNETVPASPVDTSFLHQRSSGCRHSVQRSKRGVCSLCRPGDPQCLRCLGGRGSSSAHRRDGGDIEAWR